MANTALNQSVDPGASGKDIGKELFEEANSEYDSGHYERALELYEKAMGHGVDDEVIFNNRGATLDALGRNSEATESYKQATRINHSYGLAWHNLGNSLFVQELYADAARAYTKAAALKPDRMENWSGLATAYAKMGDAKRAERAVSRLTEFVDRDPTVLLLQADLLTDAGLIEKAIDCANEYIIRNPKSPEGYEHLGNAEHEFGTYGKAIISFGKALELAPNDKELWNNLGYTSFVAGYLERAIECFDKAIAIDKDYKHAWYNKGYAYHGADMLEQAVECYREAIRIDAADRVLWNNLGNALYNLGRYAESIPKFVEAIDVDPDYEIAWNNIGNALEKMSLYREAIPYHDRSLEISPGFDYALYAKGVCRSFTGDLEGGYDLVLESLDINPTYDEAWKARARIAGELGRWDEALVSIERSLAINPEFDQGWTYRGDALLMAGNSEAAQASFEMALKCLEGARADTVSGLSALVRRGEVLSRLGRFEEALATLEGVIASKRMNSNCIPHVLELRRFLNRPELPRSVKEAAEGSTDPRVRLAYADFLLDAGYVDGAERILLTLAPADSLAASVALSRARALAMKGGLEKATQIVSALRSQLPSGDFVCAEGEILESAGKYRLAAEVLGKALNKSPSSYSCALAYARALLRLGKYKEAIEAADLAIGIDLGEWEPHMIKADAYGALGQGEKAENERKEAKARLSDLKLEPDGVLAEEFK